MHSTLPLFAGEPGGGTLATSPGQAFTNQIEASHLRAAGIQLVVATLWPPPATRVGRGKVDVVLNELDALRRFTLRNGDFAVVSSPSEVDAALKRTRIALLPAIEGAEAIRSLDDVDRLYAAGLRSIQLVHFADNALGGAEPGQLGLLSLVISDAGGGLTPFGVEVVQRLIALGVIIDVAHGSEALIADVLSVTETAGVPIIFSHAGGAVARTRNPTDLLARRIAKGGGLVGIGVFRSDFLQKIPEAERWEGFTDRTCDEVVAHGIHYARELGPQAVVFGSDFNSTIVGAVPGGECPNGLRHTGDIPDLFAALVRRGYPESSLDDSRERVMKLWQRVSVAANPEVQAAAMKRGAGPRPDLLGAPF